MKGSLKKTDRHKTSPVIPEGGMSTAAGPKLSSKHGDVSIHIDHVRCEAVGGSVLCTHCSCPISVSRQQNFPALDLAGSGFAPACRQGQVPSMAGSGYQAT